jgi:hypothetical protein
VNTVQRCLKKFDTDIDLTTLSPVLMLATASVTKIVILKQSLQKLNVVEHSTFVGRSPETVSWKTSYLVSVYE